MRFDRLRALYEEIPIFSLQHIRHCDPGFHLPRLNEWQKQHKIIKLRQGIYASAQFFKTEEHLYFAANGMYRPSYISFETALSHYNLIPEAVYSLVSATSKKTQRFMSPVGQFMYHHLKSSLMFGYVLMPVDNWHYKMASLEKAILDFLYIHTTITSPDDFNSLRWNPDVLKTINWDAMGVYLDIFNHRALTSRIQALKVYCDTCCH